ncbi:GIY-YIG nuclease family protein [Viridibacterium curvum]|uniref:GIY-YIG domain-containing protein n=1 Tax=Viridibacterium curvum TaxID=1101404 RepID=A0ABP9QWA7_9RHOO
MTSLTCTWNGLTFHAYLPDVQWADVAGIYIFAKQGPNGWQPSYVGQTISFKDRLNNHERWPEAARMGATHILVLVVPLQADRDRIEEQLIQACSPPLNTQLKPDRVSTTSLSAALGLRGIHPTSKR